MSKPTRRRFIQTVAALGAPALAGVAVTSADAAQDTPNPLAETSRLLTEAIRARHGKNIDEANLKGIQQKVQSQLTTGELLKRVTILNGDEPDFVFFAEV